MLPRSTPRSSEIDFENLPATVQRKFFTPAERNRYSRESTSLSARQNLPIRKPSVSYGPSTRQSRRLSPLNGGAGSPRVRRTSTARLSVIPLADANWFLTLPPAVKRKLFTPDEQALLAARCEKVIAGATNDALNKLERTAPPGLSTPSSTESLLTTSASNMSFNMAEAVQDSFRWLDSEETLDLHLSFAGLHTSVPDDGSVSVATASPKTKSPPVFHAPKRSITQRVGVRRRSPPRRPSPSPKTSLSHSRTRSRAAPRPSQDTSNGTVSINEPEATFYQDPAARSKLRGLASPQKFDEAIEFGFPSAQPSLNATVSTLETPTKAKFSTEKTPRPSNEDAGAQTFFDDTDDVSLVEDRTDASSPDVEYPLTPTEAELSFRSPHAVAFTKSKPPEWVYVAKPTLSHRYVAPAIDVNPGNREMTLRMTLTRPELRADDDALYGWQGKGKENLLALEDLPPAADDSSPAMGPFGGVDGWGSSPSEDGIVKKLWRRVKPGFRRG